MDRRSGRCTTARARCSIAPELSDSETVDVILCWSAIPGGSRHHWGSDVDVIDAAAVPPGYTVELVPSEYAMDGIFGRLSQWLDPNMRRFGFFQPYRTDRGGVSPEPWHLSYAPVSQAALESLSLSTLRRVLETSSIEGKSHVLARLPEIYTRFLLSVDGPGLVICRKRPRPFQTPGKRRDFYRADYLTAERCCASSLTLSRKRSGIQRFQRHIVRAARGSTM